MTYATAFDICRTSWRHYRGEDDTVIAREAALEIMDTLPTRPTRDEVFQVVSAALKRRDVRPMSGHACG